MPKSLIKLKQIDQSELAAFVSALVANVIGGEAGATAIYTGANIDPNAGNVVPSNTFAPAIYYDTGQETFWLWKAGESGWTALVK